MRSPTDKHRTAVAVTLVQFLAAADRLYRQTPDRAENDRQTARAREAFAALESTLVTLKEARAAERSFVLTGQEHFLDSYRQASARAVDQMQRLKELAQVGLGDLHQLSALEQLAASELDTLGRLVRLREQNTMAAARLRLAKSGSRDTVELRRAAAELSRAEHGRLRQRVEESAAQTGRALATLVVSMLSLGGLGALCYVSVRRNIGRSARA